MNTLITILKIALFFGLILLLYFAFSKTSSGGADGGFISNLFSSIKGGLKDGYSNLANILVPKNGS